MPRSVIENVDVDYGLPPSEIAPVLVRLAHEPVGEEEGGPPMPEEMQVEADMAELESDAFESTERPGVPSGFTCPDCDGVLWELRDGELIRYRCRVGHAYSPESLLAAQSEDLEAALWAALDALKQHETPARRVAAGARARGHDLAAARFDEQAQDAEHRAAVILKVLLDREAAATLETAAADQESSEAGGS
jgi:two-component system chemotaxis response regulator CheB